MSSSTPPVYFETSWAILSSIGLVNVLIGILVIGITSLSPVTIVPVVVSSANAIADGLCYYAFYADYPKTPTAVAAAFADVFWLIQEAGLSFYSYQILIRILRRRQRVIFVTGYWVLIAIVAIFKMSIMSERVKDILQETQIRVTLIDRLHIGYFVGIALAEMLSSYFLLRKFFSAQRSSADMKSNVGLFRHLTRSTEIRLAVLTLIGITRSITYSFQTTAQSATTVSGQVDRFVTTLECLFPIVMFIDILAGRMLARQDNQFQSSSQSYHVRDGKDGRATEIERSGRTAAVAAGAASGPDSMANMEADLEARGTSSSQEPIRQVNVSKAVET